MDGIVGPQTLFANTSVTLGTLVFNNANRYLLTGAGSLTLDASVEGALIDVRRGQHTINLPLTLGDPTTAFVAAGSTLTLADPITIAPGASLTKTGPGTLTLTSVTTDGSSLALNVNAGTIALMRSVELESLAISDEAVVLDHGTVVHADSAANLRAQPEVLGRLLGVGR